MKTQIVIDGAEYEIGMVPRPDERYRECIKLLATALTAVDSARTLYARAMAIQAVCISTARFLEAFGVPVSEGAIANTPLDVLEESLLTCADLVNDAHGQRGDIAQWFHRQFAGADHTH